MKIFMQTNERHDMNHEINKIDAKEIIILISHR